MSPACLKCGTIKKSGKASCCGRGGSWFGNCGVGGNIKLDHTWYEGIQTCKTLPQSNTAIEQQIAGVQDKGIGSNMTKFKSVFTFVKVFTLTSSVTTESHDATHASSSTAAITQGCERLFDFALLTSIIYLSLCV